MTIYGDSVYPCLISVGITDGAPSGDIIYILAKNVVRTTNSQQRKRILRNGYAKKLATGKRIINMSLSEGLIIASELNNIIAILDSSIAGTQIYFWKKIDSSTYEQFRDPTGTYKNYLYGWISNYNIKDFSNKYRMFSVSIEDGWES